jgi:TBC1 domain family protein 5
MQAMQPERLPRTTLSDSTPSAVHTRNLSRSEEPERVTNLKAQIQILEERNKSLAKTLSQALNEIRTQLMKAEDIKATTADALRQALTQIQSVQTCLEDPSEALITVAGCKSADNDTSLNVPSSPPIATDKKVDEGGAKEGQQAPSDPGRPSVSPVAVETMFHKSSSSNKVPPSLPLRQAVRPSLADSEFSWMLGGSRHLSSFVSPASVPPEETRYGDTRNKLHTLFGNGADEQQSSQDELDSLALRSLGGAEEGQGSDSTY